MDGVLGHAEILRPGDHRVESLPRHPFRHRLPRPETFAAITSYSFLGPTKPKR